MDKLDIETRSQIIELVDAFYTKVLADSLISDIFKSVIDSFWEKHINIMYDFWDSALFHTAKYKGNPMLKHIELNRKTALTENHFNRWILLWDQTIDEMFDGPNADSLKEKASSMRYLMIYKIKESENPNFIQ